MTALAKFLPGSSLPEAALFYVSEWRLCVFPVKPLGKQPALGGHGWHDATGNHLQILNWWKGNPLYNIGIALPQSGLAVLDIDPRHGGDKSLAALIDKHGPLQQTYVVATGGGGWHYYFRLDGQEYDLPKNIAPGVELLRNAYVIAPPSDTRKAPTGGGVYRVHEGSSGDFAPLPLRWVESVLSDLRRADSDRLPQDEDWFVPDGDRNVQLTRYMGMMRRYGFKAGEMVRMVQAWDPDRIENFDTIAAELPTIAESVAKYPPEVYGFDSVRISVRARKSEPTLDETKTLIGPIGDWIRTIEDITETHPAALLGQALCAFGNIIGARRSDDPAPGFMVEDRYHRTSLYAVLVGDSARAGKGDSWSRVEGLMTRVDPEWIMRGGVQTGEGLIDVLKDDRETDETATVQGEQRHFAVKGASDKRFMVVEEEFGRLLKVSKRQGQTIKEIYSELWNRGATDKITSGQKHRVTNATVGFVGHTTKPQLDQDFDYVDMMSGFGNRFLWIFTKRTKVLPLAESLPADELQDFVDDLQRALQFARDRAPEEYSFSDDAWDLWCEELIQNYDRPQRSVLLDHLTARTRPIVLRLAVIYAATDCSDQIELHHLQAADALFDYSAQSIEYIFGNRVGDKDADTMYQKLSEHPSGLTTDEIAKMLGNHWDKDKRRRALEVLQDRGLVACTKDSAGRGRPAEIWVPVLR